MMTDPIADMLTRIRNASLARHKVAQMPASNLKLAIANILKSEGYIVGVETLEKDKKNEILITLKYKNDRGGVIDGIRRVSRPGRRVYVGYSEIPKVLSGLGISVLSTSRGIMSDRQARRQKLGGELLCEVWLCPRLIR